METPNPIPAIPKHEIHVLEVTMRDGNSVTLGATANITLIVLEVTMRDGNSQLHKAELLLGKVRFRSDYEGWKRKKSANFPSSKTKLF